MKPDDEQGNDEHPPQPLSERPSASDVVRPRPGAFDLVRSRPSAFEVRSRRSAGMLGPRSSGGGIFDEALKALKELEGKTMITIPVDTDAKGYIDRECPAENCEYQFKVHLQDWEEQITENVHCPMCGTNKGSGSWWTKEQLTVANAHAKQHVEQKIYGAFAQDADRLNSSPQDSFIQMSLQVKMPEKKNLPPVPSSEAYRIEIQCEHCRFRFSVLGSAYFCPCCGRSSVERMFSQSVSTMRTKIKHARQIRDDLTKAGSPDEAADVERGLIESCVKDSVTALQCLCDALWFRNQPSETAPVNVFQRLKHGSTMWRKACGEGYEDWLGDAKFRRLVVFYQRRHLLVHSDGIVGQEYIDRSGDTTYTKGQRIVVSVAEAEEMVGLVEELANRLRAKLEAIP